MKRTSIIILASAAFALPSVVHSQVAGSSLLGVDVTELRAVTTGWSAKKQVLGKSVFNENNQRIGVVDDVVIAPDKAVSYAIIGAGGFLGVAKHDVAIPVSQFRAVDGKFFLDGATKQALREMPAFEYAR
jgi:sporulation protein YlmC with PRC-barrel domain